MTRAMVWILGRGGLLGSRLAPAIARHAPAVRCWDCIVPQFDWDEPSRLAFQLDQAAAEYARVVHAGFDPWCVIWAAGAGVIGTTPSALREETATWERLLQLLDRHLCGDKDPRPGWVFLSSSAGGTYGSCPDQVITEDSPCRPISAYGSNKLDQERLLQSWAASRPSVGCLIGRISNLYGPGQDLSKPQGLVSHISRCLIWQRPIHIYVPLDTIRDYLYVDDCAEQIASCLSEKLRQPAASCGAGQGGLKIFAAEQPTTVAQIVGAFSRLALRRHPRVLCAPSGLGLQQPRRLQFHSIVAPDLRAMPRTILPVGIHRVHQYHLTLYRQGRLPSPQVSN